MTKEPVKVNRRLREGVLIIATVISLFIFAALFTYHNSDPSWTNVTSDAKVNNVGGYVGAWVADILFFLFGYIAYLFPSLLIYAAWVNYRKLEEEPKPKFFSWKTLGFFLTLLASSCLANLYIHASLFPNAGGIFGDLIANWMKVTFNPFGTQLLSLGFLLAGITLFTGVSWLAVVDNIGKIILRFFSSSNEPKKIAKNALDKPVKLEVSNVEIKANKKVRIEPKIGNVEEPKMLSTEDVEFLAIKKPVPDKKSFGVNVLEQKAKEVKEQKEVKRPIIEDSAYVKPSLELLDLSETENKNTWSDEKLTAMANEAEIRLREFGVEAKVVAAHPGPVITRFELQLAAGTKVSKISNLAKDLARSLSVNSVRVVEVIQGKSVIGLEIPNDYREIIRLREVLSAKQFQNTHANLAIALGKDIAGNPIVVDLAKMPHLLVAGTTGSGKSVGLNAILLSLLYKYSPQEVRMVLIDPKMLELSVYDGIPHLLTPVVTDMKDASNALRWCVFEMERRYRLMAALGVRNIIGFNTKIAEAKKAKKPLYDPIAAENDPIPKELTYLPYIVVLADEFADMMMVVGKKIEELITRIAQKARAAGIHLIFATQRPSVDVITGLIKANIPSRIAFQVSAKVDSRTILDQMGAEQLLGNGDMLYLPPGTAIPMRIHGAFVSDDEVHRVAESLKKQGAPNYMTNLLEEGDKAPIPGIDATADGELGDAEQDPLYDQAVEFVIQSRKVSTSSIQRRFKIGYNRAARIVDAMEQHGLVTPMESNGNREVLVPNNE
jgi:S-DNA-T family DNA segregation ATPase FtsK/SpoIIIE